LQRLSTRTVCSTLFAGCDPKIAKWHGEFPRQSSSGWVPGKDGFLWRRQEIEDWLARPIKTIAAEAAPSIAGFDVEPADPAIAPAD
jgi:hypothetical protein